MKRPCKAAITCPGTDSPVLNLSSEAPDQLSFFGIIYAPIPRVPLGGDPAQVYQSANCYGVAFSAESQTEADLLARLSGAICKEPQSQQYSNDPQTATAVCPGGSVFSYTVPAGMITVATDPDPDAWIAASNAAALAYAEQQASSQEQMCCLNPTTLSPHPSWMCLNKTLAEDSSTEYAVGGLNSPGVWNFSVIGGALPTGTFLVPTGNNSAQILGTPTVPGDFTFTIQAVRPAQPLTSVSVTDTISVFGITNPVLPDGIPGIAYSEQILTAGSTAPVTFDADPLDLPDGLSMDATGLVTGTPTLAGVFDFDVDITDAEGKTCTQTVTIEVETFDCISNSDTLPNGSIGAAYSQTLLSTFGTGPRTFTTTDALPAGLTLHSSGLIDGTPSSAGITGFVVTVTDSLMNHCTNLCSIQITGFDCGATPQNVQDLVWTLLTDFPPCVTGSIVAGVCNPWHIRVDDQTPPPSGSCTHDVLEWSTSICNPGAEYSVVVTLPYASSGGVILPSPAPHAIGLLVQIGANSDAVYGDLNTDTPNPLVATVNVPANAISSFFIRIELQAIPQAHSWVALDSAGNLTITPLIHP